MAHLRHRARENLKRHIHQTIPEEYQKACNTLNQVLRMTWGIISKTEDEKTRLQALSLINDLNKYRTELVTNGVIVNDALRIVQSKMEHLNGKGKGEVKKLLHDIKDKGMGDTEVEAEAETGELEEQPTHNGIF
jgi:hypothetical protein